MKRNTSGFTIIELLIVIAIIGVLTTITVVSYSVIQANSRDSQRSSKITVLAEALEKYYDQNGEYPSCAAMAAASNTVASVTLKGLDPTALSTPSASNGANSILAACSSLGIGSDAIAYVGDGSATCTTTNCLQFTLQYREESTGNIISVNSRRKTDVATSGNITNLAATPVNFVQVNLTWGLVNNATSYTVQRATNSGFTAGLVQTSSVSNSTSITGLTAGTTYYFRVVPNSTTGIGSQSNTASATTPQLATPTATATANSSTQITLDWNDISLATSYTAQMSTSSSFTSPTTVTGITTSTKAFTGLVASTTYYFRVEALATGDTSNWSATVSAVILATPVATAVANSTTQITLDWGDIVGATSYTAQLSTSSSFTSPTTSSGIATSTKAFTGLTQGTVYYLRVEALNANGTSSWSGTVTDNTYYSMVATSSSANSSNSFPATVAYNSGGYTGTLNQNGGSFVSSGSAAGSTGTSTSSSSYIRADYCRWNSTTGYMNYIENYSNVGDWYSPGKPADTYWYNDGTYSGTLGIVWSQTSVAYTSHATPPYNPSFDRYAHVNGTVYITAFHYGNVYYSGTVSKPDTRQYTQNYSGTVTKP